MDVYALVSGSLLLGIGYSQFTAAAGQTVVNLGSIDIPQDPNILLDYQYNSATNTISLYATPLTQDQYQVLAASTPALAGRAAYNAAISAGCQIVSTGTPALNGTYPLDDSTLLKAVGEQSYIALKSTFTNGQMTRAWMDVSGAPHVFPSTAEFTAFGEAIAQYVDALQTALGTALAGGSWVAPAQPVTIP